MAAASDRSGIPILYIDDSMTGGKGLFSAAKELPAQLGIVDSDALGQSLSAICAQLGDMFRRAEEAATGPFGIDEFEIALDVTAMGEVRMVASVGSEIHGGLKLVFRRQNHK